MKASCQCGALSASVSGDSARVVCHCTACQKRTGSPFGYIAYYPGEAVTVTGNCSSYQRTTDSGGTFTNFFCPNCGSTVYVQSSKHTDGLGIPVGAFAAQDFPSPHRAVYDDRRHHWIIMPDGLDTYGKGRS